MEQLWLKSMTLKTQAGKPSGVVEYQEDVQLLMYLITRFLWMDNNAIISSEKLTQIKHLKQCIC